MKLCPPGGKAASGCLHSLRCCRWLHTASRSRLAGDAALDVTAMRIPMPRMASKMRIGSAIMLCLLLVACAAPPVQRPDFLLQDESFAAPAERINAEDVFALSEEMQEFARREIAGQSRENGRYRALFDALYRKRQLKLDYDSAVTRNAAEAFAARSGNCLSLVVMTAAFAKELGIQVQYQSAIQDAPWSRSGSLYLRNGHV